MANWCMMLSPLFALEQFRVLRICRRIMANVDSMGLVVRMCCQCATGKWQKASNAA